VIPNANITAIHIAPNLNSTTLSNAAGVYNLLFLPIGDCRLTVEVAGFKRVESLCKSTFGAITVVAVAARTIEMALKFF
jgi:hypothetical protein